MAHDVWILGATGRTGRAVVARLAGTDLTPVLVGRDADRLKEAAGGLPTVVAGSPEVVATRIAQDRPAVVVNTIGPFSRTALPIARACLAGSHYVDLANDVTAVIALLGLHDEAVAAGRTLVTGAGFGVLATEAVVATLCAGRPTPSSVRVDALASVETEAGEIGSALAATLVEGVALGGRRYTDGRFVRARLGGEPRRLTLPDGDTATSAANVPTGELAAAQLASGAPSVTAASGFAPTAPLVRAVLPLAGALLTLRSLHGLAVRRLAGTHVSARPRPREYSWGHAVVQWTDGTEREGWLRTGDAMDFTTAVVAEAALRLARGDGRPGAFTPAAAFGAEIATDAGGELLFG
jgi:short subunit dehydrogenase-like uncharacterized protein